MNIPYSKEAERALLGSALLRGNVVDIEPVYFYIKAHECILRGIHSLQDKGEEVNTITLSEELKKNEELDLAGGYPYLIELQGEADYQGSPESQIKIIKEKYRLRKNIEIGNLIANGDGSNIGPLVAKLQEKPDKNRTLGIKDIITNTINYIQKKDKSQGIPSGITKFDDEMGGFHQGDMIILAARPGMGKTAFAVNIMMEACKAKYKPMFFSLEMGHEQIGSRMLSYASGISSSNMRNDKMSSEDYERLTQSAADLTDIDIHINDKAGMSISEICSEARNAKKKEDIDMVVIDYLQLIRSNAKSESKNHEVSEISRALKELARELKIPVIVLSQLSRSPEQRTEKRPIISDLRDSGAIEQDADLILFLYRDCIYNHGSDPNESELIVSKNRHGPSGTIKMFFHGPTTKFCDWS